MSVIIAVDAMGADAGPQVAVLGALQALATTKIDKIVLVGRESEITPILSSNPYDTTRIEVVNATEVIDTEESPVAAIKAKKDSSIVVGLNLVKNGKAHAFVSAGSTGALLTGATTIVGRIKGIKRPALGVLLPNTTSGYTFLIDAGANVDVKPEYLLQFAQMGSVYMEHIMGIKSPKVGLVNIGVEKEKGNALTKAAYELLDASNVNFAGNLEARELPSGACDVAVCDAFVGNIILKYAEGLAKGIFGMIKQQLMAKFSTKLGALLAKPAFGKIRKSFDYAEVGGAAFIGLNGLVVKAHGSSNAKAIMNSIIQCEKFISADVVGKIKEVIDLKGDDTNGI
ncbi:MAG: phosphate acyltransferase PlsX [Defluviitaleaceae bacterium]|nr:phosphate acyltransferase PlsX [Defluviitaleaceae bacterium]